MTTTLHVDGNTLQLRRPATPPGSCAYCLGGLAAEIVNDVQLLTTRSSELRPE